MPEIELINKRNFREKHFLQENGEIVARMYDQDIHYFKDGKFEEIDNTLIEDENYYLNKCNDFKVKFNKSMKDFLIELEKDNNYLRLGLNNINDYTLMKDDDSNSIKYVTEKNDIELNYEIISNKLKESIILNNNDALIDNLVFSVNTNLKLRQDENKNIYALKDEEIVFEFAPPYMIDSNHNINNKIYYNLIEENNAYAFKLIVDHEWLNDENTLYPVTIDPTITKYNDSNSVSDTYIFPNDQLVDRNSQEYLKVGVEKVNGNDVINRTLIKFDLPQLETGSQVISANLRLTGYPDYTHSFARESVNIYRVTQNWQETDANWNTMNDKYDSRVEGTFESNRMYFVNPDSSMSLSICGADITNLVKKWYTDTDNFGIMLKTNSETYKTDVIPMFFSKNNNVQGGNPKPLLMVTYRNQNGLESYMDYQVQELSHGKVYHNNYNGNLTAIFDLAKTIGGKMPAHLLLVYNTNDVVLNQNIGYGLGYRLNLSQTIEQEIIDNKTYLKYIDEDGTFHYFLNQKVRFEESIGYVTTTYENTFFDEDGLDLVIERTNSYYLLKDKNNNQMKFIINNSIGYLSEITDVAGNMTTITYDSNHRITQITDADNQTIVIYYGIGSIMISTPPVMDRVFLSYDTNNFNLISISKGLQDNRFWNITVNNQNNLISSIEDVSGKKISYEYYAQSPYRIKKVSEYGINNGLGKFYNVSYGFNATTITDSNDRIKTITFNNYGNPISISNSESQDSLINSYGMVSNYGEPHDGINTYNNKLLNNEIPLKYVKNYVSDSSFERGTINFIHESNINIDISTNYSNTGLKSLYLNALQAGKKIYQDYSVPKGHAYTLSAFIRTVNPNYGNMDLSLSYFDSNNQLVEKVQSFKIPNDSFERFDITIEYPEDATSGLKAAFILVDIGYYYLDDVQLEMSEVANNYNILENSDFSNGTVGWDLSARKKGTINALPTADFFEVVNVNNDTKALKINMNPDCITNMTQIFKVNGRAGDTYNLSFWYKNEGLVGSTDMGDFTYNNVIFNFIPTDEQHNDNVYNKTFNPNEKEWQYFSSNFTAQWDFKEIRVNFVQQNNANVCYITNLNLFRDVRSVSYNYDENGNVIFSKNLDNKSMEYNYDKNNQLIKSTNPRGKNFVYEYDNVITDRVLRGISTSGISNEIIYDSFGNPKVTKIINKGKIEIDTNNLYRIRSKGTNKDFRIVNNNLVLVDTNCEHDKWILEKVVINNVEYYKIKHSMLTNKYITVIGSNVVVSNYSNDDSLFILSKNDNGSYFIKNKVTNTYLKINNNTLTLASLDDNTYNFEFYFESTADGYFIESDAEYTDDGKFITSVTDTMLNKTSYNINSSTGLMDSTTNANDVTTNYQYNNNKQLTSVTIGDNTVNYQYNNQKLLSKIIQGLREYNITYNEFLRLQNIKVGNNINLVTNTYEENNGNLLSTTYGNNQTINYEYDEFNRKKHLIKMDDIYSYYYNNNGDLAKVKSNNYEIKYTYDLAKRLYDYVLDNYRIRYGYDDNGNIISKKYKLENINCPVTIQYNDEDLPSVVNFEDQINDRIFYYYDSLGRLENSKINNSYSTNYTYVNKGKRTSLLIKSIENNNDKYSYLYDRLNDITHIKHNDVLENEYFYDEYNELIEEKNYITNEKITYLYDSLGNMLSKTVYDLNTGVLKNEDSYEYSNANWKDQLTKFNNENITYDGMGNPLTIGNDITLTWINGRELSNYVDSNNNISYKYNKDGIRESKIVNNIKTEYYLEGSKIIFEKTGNDVLYYMRDDVGNLVGFKYNNILYYYVKNAQNDIIQIIDATYNIVAKYSYDAWGNIISITDGNNVDVSTDLTHIANINPYRYRSYYYDKETGLYYLNSRYYNPLWSRFLNADSVISQPTNNIMGLNLYIYCYNNPVSSCDSNGRGPIWNWISNNIVKPIERTLIKIATKFTKSILPHASNLLNHSLQDNPQNLFFDDNTELAQNIKSSSEFKTAMSTLAKNEPNGKFVDKDFGITFNEPDLELGLHLTTAFVTGKLSDGNGCFEVSIYDKYDFAYSNKYIGGKFLYSIFKTTVNNIAYASYLAGYIQDYYIRINLNYCINSD